MRKFLFLIIIFSSINLYSQKRFETRIGVSYDIFIYQRSNNNSTYLDNPKSIFGPGFFIRYEYLFKNSNISIQTGLDIINTNISFVEYYMSYTPVFVNSRYRHSLHIIEMQLPLNIRKRYEMSKEMNWYYYGGALLRYIPYAYGFVFDQEGSLVNKGQLYMKIEDFPFSPNIGFGIEILKNNKNLFAELNYQYSIGRYFYGGNNDKWHCDQLIDFRHFILIKVGLKI